MKLKIGLTPLYLHYPHIKTLRLFWMCAEYAFVQHQIGVVAQAEKPFWWDWDAAIQDVYLAWEPEKKIKEKKAV